MPEDGGSAPISGTGWIDPGTPPTGGVPEVALVAVILVPATGI